LPASSDAKIRSPVIKAISIGVVDFETVRQFADNGPVEQDRTSANRSTRVTMFAVSL
jgi:hypothetical protein